MLLQVLTFIFLLPAFVFCETFVSAAAVYQILKKLIKLSKSRMKENKSTGE